MNKTTKQLLILVTMGALLAFGILLVLIACITYDNYYPMFILISFFFAPIPIVLCGTSGTKADPFGEMHDDWADFGYFLFGVLTVSGFGMIFVMAHTNLISIQAIYLVLTGGFLVYVDILIFFRFYLFKKIK